MDYKLKKIKSDIEFEQNINKLIKEVIILAAQIGVKEIKTGLDKSTDIKGVEVCAAIKNIFSMIIGAAQSLNNTNSNNQLNVNQDIDNDNQSSNNI